MKILLRPPLMLVGAWVGAFGLGWIVTGTLVSRARARALARR